MIRVTVELVSAVDPSRDRLLGVAYINNEGDAADRAGNLLGCMYRCNLSKWAPKERQTWKETRGVIGGELTEILKDPLYAIIGPFDNVRRGAWDLLYLALRATVGSRNP